MEEYAERNETRNEVKIVKYQQKMSKKSALGSSPNFQLKGKTKDALKESGNKKSV